MTINDQFAGTGLCGYIFVTLPEMIRTLGDPEDPTDADKSHFEWRIASPVGPVTVYDYGQIHECNGLLEVDPFEPIEWHVGGHHEAAVTWLAAHLDVPAHFRMHRGCCDGAR